ncbi:major facilitator superfamily domain-containing protein [Sporodiniella umbellata]|nr:major facilitator superfamily domain-containing protein [Sporodiniella umbellata]
MENSSTLTDTTERTDLENQKITTEKKLAYGFKDEPDNPLNWPKRKRYSVFFVVFWVSFVGYFSSSIYIPALKDITAYFDTDPNVMNATVALFILMNAIAPLFFAPLSERVGRRWVYIPCMFLYTVCTIVCGVSNNLGLFFAFRLLQGVFGSVGQAVGGGSVSDLFEPHERGKAMGFYFLGTVSGPAVAPVIGGYTDQYLGWRWIFYLQTIIGGIITLALIFFAPETLHKPGTKLSGVSYKERLARLKFNPFVSLRLLLYPEVGLSCIPIAIAFGWFYYLVTILPRVYSSKYDFSTGSIGLCYIAGGLGNILGSVFGGIYSDRSYTRKVAKNNGTKVKEWRLEPVYIGCTIYLVGALLYGWLVEYRIFWFAPLVGYTIVTFGLMFAVTSTNTYLLESHTKTAASVVSSNAFLRNVFAMILSLCSIPIRSALGDGWSYTLMGLMVFASCLILLPIVQKYGPQWRERSA